MRATFTRMADRRPVLTIRTRDDGVAFTLRGAGGGADLPHDLVHLLVETEPTGTASGGPSPTASSGAR